MAPPTRPGVGAAAGWRAGVAGVATILGTVGTTFTIFFAMGRRPMDECLDTEWTKRYGCHPRTLPPISYTFNNLPERYCAIPGCVLASRLTENPAVRVLLLEAGGKDDATARIRRK